jgi:hypothetical protein
VRALQNKAVFIQPINPHLFATVISNKPVKLGPYSSILHRGASTFKFALGPQNLRTGTGYEVEDKLCEMLVFSATIAVHIRK